MLEKTCPVFRSETNRQLYDQVSSLEINASTIAKRSLAQYTPNPMAMVPASVHVKRKTVTPKAISKPLVPTFSITPRPTAPSIVSPELTYPLAAISKPQSIDDSCMAFLKDVKMLGASRARLAMYKASWNLEVDSTQFLIF